MVSHAVASGLARLFGSADHSDCTIEFTVEDESTTPHYEPPKTLPGHTMVLRLASEWFRMRIDKYAGGTLVVESGGRPNNNIRVILADPDEVHDARAAIKFAYTGALEDSTTVPRLLGIMRQGDYLQIQGCAAACLRGILDHDVVDLYASMESWPNASSCPEFFNSIIEDAKQRLLLRFGDALTVLNTPDLKARMVTLPVIAMETLLESDQFGADCENTILLLLATWMQANFDKTDPVSRERLCRRVRLIQLEAPFATLVLPLLAIAHEKCAGTLNGWFPITVSEAMHLVFSSWYPTLSLEPPKSSSSSGGGSRDSWWYEKTTIRQWAGASVGVKWSLEAGAIKAALAGGSKQIDILPDSRIVHRGMHWRPCLEWAQQDKQRAMYVVSCLLPDEYQLNKASIGGDFSVSGCLPVCTRMETFAFVSDAIACTVQVGHAVGRDRCHQWERNIRPNGLIDGDLQLMCPGQARRADAVKLQIDVWVRSGSIVHVGGLGARCTV